MDKNTQLFGSFSSNPGNQGSLRFNNAFKKNNINAAYKSFEISNIEDAFKAAKTLKFSGFTISMPFKEEALKYCTIVEQRCKDIKSVNTVIINQEGSFIGYNSDYFGIRNYFNDLDNFKKDLDQVVIIGMGAYARTASYVFEELGYRVSFISGRSIYLIDSLRSLNNKIIFNATPKIGLSNWTENKNLFIDCDVNTYSGRRMSFNQAKHQFYNIFGFSSNFIFEEIVI